MVIRQRRLRGDGGAAMIEMALISPVFFALLLGVFEYGLVYRDVLTTADAAGDGSRVGSQQGNDVLVGGETADYTIVDTVRMGLAGLDPEPIERVVIHQAGPPSVGNPVAQVPATCRRIRYTVGSAPTDRTTWAVVVKGDPVRLIPNDP